MNIYWKSTISLASNSQRNLKCVSLNNWPCQTTLTLNDINSNETLFYPLTVSVTKFDRSCTIIDHAYACICVPNKVKNMNVKVFNLMS